MPDDTLVAWKDEFSVENKVIDEQHRLLIQTTNDLYAGCRRGGITERLAFMKTIQGAVSYAKTHFAVEENLMRKADYPDYPAHKNEHEHFIAEVMRQVKEFEGNHEFNAENFAKYLLDWILNHIAKSDKKYTPYLRDV